MAPNNSDAISQFRRLIHELAEALTAAGAFLYAGRQVEDPARQREAIDKARDQINRADEAIVQLRALVDGMEEV